MTIEPLLNSNNAADIPVFNRRLTGRILSVAPKLPPLENRLRPKPNVLLDIRSR
jgi:hypothetical protein